MIQTYFLVSSVEHIITRPSPHIFYELLCVLDLLTIMFMDAYIVVAST